MGDASQRATDPAERYRLYVDESGDHVFNQLDSPTHRYLCLLGCWFRGADYRNFHRAVEDFKQRHIPHNPDEPLILHRDDIINRRGPYWHLREPEAAGAFDRELLELLTQADFRVVAVVIDKLRLQANYPTPAHPYHLAMGFMLQRYCGYLNHINRCGDVMAESRGGREDMLLKSAYQYVYGRGVFGMQSGGFFQKALTSRELKVKPKTANIAGLQLADLLGHPVRQAILIEKGLLSSALGPFAARLLLPIEAKFNRHLYEERVWGYGKVLFPTK